MPETLTMAWSSSILLILFAIESMTLSSQSIVVASQAQVSSNLQEESVILDVQSGTYYGLNDVGASIWAIIQEPTTVASIQSAIISEYDVTPEACNQDVLDLLHQLMEIGLVRIHDEALH